MLQNNTKRFSNLTTTSYTDVSENQQLVVSTIQKICDRNSVCPRQVSYRYLYSDNSYPSDKIQFAAICELLRGAVSGNAPNKQENATAVILKTVTKCILQLLHFHQDY